MKTTALILFALLAVPLARADQKVSDRTALAAGSLAPATDILPIVDVGRADPKRLRSMTCSPAGARSA
jgi:hypothetical protein